MAIEQDMLDALIQHQVYSFRASTKVVSELQDGFIKSSNSISSRLRDLLDELTDAEKTALIGGKYTTDSLKEIKSLFDELYSSVAVSLPETFAVSAVALAVYESSYISKLYGEPLELDGDKIFNKAKKMPIVGGQLYDEIWKNLAESTRRKALYAVREGIDNGLTTAEIVGQIRGKRVKKANGGFEYVGGVVQDLTGNGSKKGSIDSAVRTIRNHVSNTAYNDVFSALGFDYRKVVATLDGKTCPICSVRDGDFYKVGDSYNPPPWHFRTRTVIVGCDKDGLLSGKRPFVADTRSVRDIPKSERKDIIGQVDANTTYKEFFDRQPVDFQKEVLGSTKYALYKEGGFGLDRFVDPLNKEYTIAELRVLDAATFKRLGL